MSLQGSMVDVHFDFQSDDDGRNGINDGFKGIGFNNISLQEYTFVQDAVYTDSEPTSMQKKPLPPLSRATSSSRVSIVWT